MSIRDKVNELKEKVSNRIDKKAVIIALKLVGMEQTEIDVVSKNWNRLSLKEKKEISEKVFEKIIKRGLVGKLIEKAEKKQTTDKTKKDLSAFLMTSAISAVAQELLDNDTIEKFVEVAKSKQKSQDFPREYDAELGITARQFQYLCRRAKSLFESEEKLDQAYRNISDQLLEKTGKTKAQVLLAYNDYTISCGHNPFAKIYSRFPDKSTNRVVKIRFGDGADGYLEFTETDTKNFEIFNAMFAGKDISEAEMKTIEGIVKTYEPGYVASESEYQKQFLSVVEEIEGQWIKGEVSKIEPNLPSEEIEVKPVPPIIPPKGNGR